MRKIFEPDELYFVPLGGSEEFGCNLNVYVCDGEFLAIDCGLGFADERFPGIDLILPDPQLLVDNKDKLKGLIITHAHEDHIGAVARLWKRFKCPIYTSQFTAAVLRKKLEEEGLRKVPIHIVESGSDIQIGNFNAEFIPVSHSVPDSCSIFLKTRHGNVLHSGDWNLDPNPVVGIPTEEKTFRRIGDEGVLAYIGDSTNSQVDGLSGAEDDVAKGMIAEFKKCKGKIAVTMFSSNIGRLITITRAAQETGRSVVLIGRSLKRMAGCAIDCGLMKGVPEFLDESDLSDIADENIVCVVTGSQGEHRAALAKIARGDFRSVKLNRGDTVIFSARPIPGNERTINTVKNNLSAGGVRIVTTKDTENIIHVSGHPCRDEIAAMLQWLRPDCVIPVHGERIQLDAHSDFAKECQIKHSVVPNNGSVIRLAPGKPEIVDHIETGLLAVDQRRIIPSTHQSITARRKLQYSGIVHASLVLDHDLSLLGDIKVNTVGISCERSKDCIIEELEESIFSTLDELPMDMPLDENKIAETIRIPLMRYVNDKLGIRPKTTVHVTLLDV